MRHTRSQRRAGGRSRSGWLGFALADAFRASPLAAARASIEAASLETT